MLKGSINERAFTTGVGSNSTGDILSCHCTIRDVGRRRWQILEYGFVDSEILGQDITRGSKQPIVDIEGGSIKKIVLEG